MEEKLTLENITYQRADRADCYTKYSTIFNKLKDLQEEARQKDSSGELANSLLLFGCQIKRELVSKIITLEGRLELLQILMKKP